MYNNNDKLSFINTINSHFEGEDSLSRIYEVLFNMTENLENDLNKDVSEFNSNNIIDLYKSISTTSVERLMLLTSHLKRYTEYMLLNKKVKDNQNHFREVNREMLMQCINAGLADRKITTRENLLKEIVQIPNVSEQFIALALFEGLRGKLYSRLHNLYITDFHNGVVDLKHEGISLKVSPKLTELAKDSAEETRYWTYNADYTITETKGFEDNNNKKIIKNLKNVVTANDDMVNFARRLQAKLVRIEKYTGSPIYNAQALIESGRIEAIQNIMNGGDLNEAIKKYNKNKELVIRYGNVYNPSLYITKFAKFFE